MKEVERQQTNFGFGKRIESQRSVGYFTSRSIYSIYKVRNNLIESNPSRYLSVGTGGNYVENWFQLNKDARKLQSILKGNVPAPGTNLQRLLTESPDNTINESVLNKGKTSVRNPYRKLWEQRGVQWPTCKVKDLSNNTCKSTKSSLSSSNSAISPEVDETEDEAPPSLSDEYLLALGIRESLKTTGVEDKTVVIEPELAVLNTSIPIIDRNSATIADDSTLGGLDALAEACKTFFCGRGIARIGQLNTLF